MTREEMLKIICDETEGIKNDINRISKYYIDMAFIVKRIEYIERIVADLQKDTGWIPCEERLPDEPGVYLVTIFTSGGRNAVAINYFYDVGRWWMGDTYQISKVTAWMPLPEPWKGDRL